ncbi:MAG: carbonic anhydrase [Bacteriovoracia bacterium]
MSLKNNVTSKEALERLKEGNRRFISGLRSVNPLISHLKMPDLARKGQTPFAIVLTCSDSRSPAELIFDEGLGELFVVRVAGNVVAPSLLASMEFAAVNFGSAVILVLGHSQCGAVKATIDHIKNPNNELPSSNLEELVGRIRPAVQRVFKETNNSSEKDFSERCEVENVRRSMSLIIEQSQILRNLVHDNKLSVHGALLDLESGKVNFLD